MKEPTILNIDKHDEQEVILTLHIPADLPYFKGHFPKTPILPGIVQLNWARLFAERYLNLKRDTLIQIKQLKFTKVIHPDTEITLSLKKTEKKFSFAYRDGDTAYSSGIIAVES